MGYFGVLSPSGADKDATFDVTRCHINVWVLRSFFPGRRLLYFDLGLEISPTGAKPVEAIEVLLPFMVEEGFKGDQFKRCMDLYDTLFHEETAELIFGEPVTMSGQPPDRKLTLKSGSNLHPRHIDTAKVAASPNQPPQSSCYVLPLVVPATTGTPAYVRMRFRVFANRPLLTAKSPFGGVILDFRIADVRESRSRSSEVDIRRRLVPIERVDFFAMLPVQYQLVTDSPQLRYMRVLETRAWGYYLNRVAYMHPTAQLVYYWRGTNASSDNPFRVFASYDRHLNKARVVLWTTVATLLVAGLLRSDWISGLDITGIRTFLWHHLHFLGLASLAGIMAAGQWFINFATNRFAKPRMVARWLERLILGRRLGP